MRKTFFNRGNTAKVLLLAGIAGAGLWASEPVLSQNVTTQSETALTLVTNKQANAIIVTADKPTAAASLAARVLADHIHQITGAEIEITTEGKLKDAAVKEGKIFADAGGKSTFILVGETQLAAQLGVTAEGLGAGGIRLRTVGNALILLGADNADKRPLIKNNPNNPSQQTTNDRNASLYAVTTFLENQLGVRYLWPGESGKIIPQHNTITVSPVDLSYTPLIKQRHIRHNLTGKFSPREIIGLGQLGVEEKDYPLIHQRVESAKSTVSVSPDWYTWQGLGGSMGLKTGHSFGYAWEKYGKTHPEWFALQPNGSRDQSVTPGRARFDISNKELQAAIAQDRIEELDHNPGQASVSIDPNDGGYNTFCLDEACRALDPPGAKLVTRTWTNPASKDKKVYTYQLPASLTDRMVYFWNSIAEKVTAKYPNVLLTVRAYSMYKEPPTMRKLNPNIAVEQVSSDYFDKNRVSDDLKNWTEWGKFTQNLAWRPNIDASNRRHGFPVIYVHRMAADVKARFKAGMISTDIDSLQKNWSPNALNIYVLARLLWDPSRNVDDIIDDFCNAGFGKGAPYIKKYFSRIEEITMKAADTGAANPKDNYRAGLMISTLAELYNPATLKELNGLLDQAKQAAGDEDVSRRIEFMRLSLTFTAVQAPAFRMIDEAKEEKQKIDRKAVIPFMKKRYSVMRYIFLNYPTAIDIPYLLWGSEGNFRALQSKESWKLLANRDNDDILQKLNNAAAIVDADEYGNAEKVTPEYGNAPPK